MQNTAVVINMDSQILRGRIAIQDGKRLLDFLNERYPGSGEIECSPFIALTEVQIQHRDGREENTETMYINHRTIRMVRTSEADDARGNAVKTRNFPYVPKLPVMVTIYTSDSELTGYLHCREKQDIANLLALRKPFIPCTGVKIHNLLAGTWEEAAFAAVNSEQIFSIKKRKD